MLNASIVMAAVVVHEFGHYTFGSISGCSNMKIILFDSATGGTYTQMDCPVSANRGFLALGGFLFVTVFSLVFFLMKGLNERRFWFVVTGFNLIASYSDIAAITQSFIMPSIFAFSGAFMLISGEFLLIDRYIFTETGELRSSLIQH